jgi:hypothetical protein
MTTYGLEIIPNAMKTLLFSSLLFSSNLITLLRAQVSVSQIYQQAPGDFQEKLRYTDSVLAKRI